jgi:hypothetical protein
MPQFQLPLSGNVTQPPGGPDRRRTVSRHRATHELAVKQIPSAIPLACCGTVLTPVSYSLA